MLQFREEKDFIGLVKVPSNAYYGSFTARALDNFRISGLKIDVEFIHSLAEIKMAAAKTNVELGFLEEELAKAIVEAAEEILTGKFDEQFPIDIFQAGAGTPWNMNMNEVVANRANEMFGSSLGSYERVHPNDHVNMSQSSNDVIPTATRLTALKLIEGLARELSSLEGSLESKAEEFKDLLKSGRTHLRDAVPIALGQEFKAYASAMRTSKGRIKESTENLRKISLGGTAVGTGINTHPDYSKLALKHLREVTGLELSAAEDTIEKTQFTSDFLQVMNALGELATDTIKIGNDLMLLSSGPKTGLNELTLPTVEPGSSIMPGKTNPSIIECVNMVCFQVLGNRKVLEIASLSGNLDLNVYVPVIAFNLFNSIRWLTNAIHTLNHRCMKDIRANREAMEYYFNYSEAFATLLTPIIGYEKAAELVKESSEKDIPIQKLILDRKILTKNQLEDLIIHSNSPNLHTVKKLKSESS